MFPFAGVVAENKMYTIIVVVRGWDECKRRAIHHGGDVIGATKHQLEMITPRELNSPWF